MAEEDKIENPSEEVKEENTTPPEEKKEPETSEETKEAEVKEEADEKEKKEDVKEEGVDLENPDEVSEALNKKGIDYNKLTEEYMANGKLSEQSMADLMAVGITPEMVNNYIKGGEARAELERNELGEVVGGRDKLEEIVDWAAHNLSKEEIVSLNAIRDKFQLKATLIGLKVRMEEKEGITPEYQKGEGGKAAIVGYRSQAEMFEAIKDPKYQKDEAYRADVQKKIAASREAGIDLGIY